MLVVDDGRQGNVVPTELGGMTGMSVRLSAAPRPNPIRPPLPALVRRSARLAAAATLTLRDFLLAAAQGGKSEPARITVLVAAIPRFGPAAVKVAQLAATRRDLLPEDWCDELSVLWGDRIGTVLPADRAHTERVLLDNLPDLAQPPSLVGRGSIACVYHVTLPDGTENAVKVIRPDVRDDMTVDVWLIRRAARLIARALPLGGLPIVAMIDELADAVLAQTDLDLEAENLDDLHRTLSPLPDVIVPRPVRSSSSKDVLVMDWAPPVQTGTGDDLRTAETIMSLVYHMLFCTGVVHVDLHPGNLHVSSGKVVVHDAGFVIRIEPRYRRALALFFLGLAVGDARGCGKAVLQSCDEAPDEHQQEQFIDALETIVDAYTGARSKEFNVVAFSRDLFTVQRRFGVYPSPEFVFPLTALVTVEGQVRSLHPDLDFQALSIPYVGAALEAA